MQSSAGIRSRTHVWSRLSSLILVIALLVAQAAGAAHDAAPGHGGEGCVVCTLVASDDTAILNSSSGSLLDVGGDSDFVVAYSDLHQSRSAAFYSSRAPPSN